MNRKCKTSGLIALIFQLLTMSVLALWLAEESRAEAPAGSGLIAPEGSKQEMPAAEKSQRDTSKVVNGLSHPLLTCREIYRVEIVGVTNEQAVSRKEPGAWPAREFRRTVTFQVLETLLGDRKTRERFDVPAVYYHISGSDRPTTSWENVSFNVGGRYLYAPGGRIQWNQNLDGIHEEPMILKSIFEGVQAGSTGWTPDLDDIRAILVLRAMKPELQGKALRERLLGRGFSVDGRYPAAQLFMAHPEQKENIEAIVRYVTRYSLDNDTRLQWVRNLELFPVAPQTEAHRVLLEGHWRILDRGAPPYGENPRVNLDCAVWLTQALYPMGEFTADGWAPGLGWEKTFLPPREFIPKGCSTERILNGLLYAKLNDTSHYMFDAKEMNYNPILDVLIEYVRKREAPEESSKCPPRP